MGDGKDALLDECEAEVGDLRTRIAALEAQLAKALTMLSRCAYDDPGPTDAELDALVRELKVGR
jgi:hypothetical protein